MKIVLSDDTNAEIPVLFKLKYLERKYGTICAYVYVYKTEQWVRLLNPFSVISDDVSVVRHLPDNGKMAPVYEEPLPEMFSVRYDLKTLYLNKHLRIDKDFIEMIEEKKQYDDWDFLRIENIPFSEKDYLENKIRIVEYNNREFVKVK